jgi:hypothetical protein
MLLARGGRSLTLGWVGVAYLEDAHTKCMSIFEADERLQR